MCKQEVDAVCLFIAELAGSFEAGSGTKEDKIKCGQQDYITQSTPELDLTTEEGCKDVHEKVWLERLYTELDDYFEIKPIRSLRALSIAAEAYRKETYKWSVPIELDATSSMLQIVGVLLNDRRLMEMTNVIGTTLEDAWKVKGLLRKKVKSVMTPKLYGSSRTAEDFWKKDKLSYTSKDVSLINKELQTGAFGLANEFKDFIINNCKPAAEMEIKIGDDEFSISCNKFRNTKEVTKAYKIWDSVDNRYNTILHTDVSKVPDLEQFRLYFMTLIVHNLDSQIMDNLSKKVMDKYGWGISVHDAILVSPAAAVDVRYWYGLEITSIHERREEILSGFFKSVGINALAADEWENIKRKVQQLEGELVISMPLK